MAKNKISEYSATAANNTDIGGINIAEGCAPSGINNAIRELMAQLKDQQAGTDGDNFTVGGAFTCTGAAVFSSTVAVTGAMTLSSASTGVTASATDDSTKLATTAFVRDIIPTGVIVMWSGSIASIPTGWLICDGSNSTPDLRNRFIVGAGSTYSVAGTGGTADAIVVSHTHTATVTDPGHAHNYTQKLGSSASGGFRQFEPNAGQSEQNTQTTSSATTGVSVSVSSTGSSATNANLPPYYALAYIMKA
jgi:microcystin-dependent protein